MPHRIQSHKLSEISFHFSHMVVSLVERFWVYILSTFFSLRFQSFHLSFNIKSTLHFILFLMLRRNLLICYSILIVFGKKKKTNQKMPIQSKGKLICRLTNNFKFGKLSVYISFWSDWMVLLNSCCIINYLPTNRLCVCP